MMVRNEVLGNGIGTITLAHPPLNILTQALLAELRGELARLAEEPGLRVLLLAAEGEHFSAGADVGEHLPPQFRSLIPEFVETIRMIAEFPLPVIAVVRGRCLGGGFVVAQAADVIVAGEMATFGQPEVRLGVTAPAACVLLPALCAPGLAAEMLFTGDAIDARKAADAGLIGHVVPDDQVMEEAIELASRMARHSAAALRATKRTMRPAVSAASGTAAWGPRLAAAGTLYVEELMATRDAHEGLRAFLEKRKPAWTHT